MMRSDRGRPWFWLGFAAGGIEISILFAMSFGKWKELPWPALALTGLLGPFGALTMFAATFVVPQWMPGSVEDPFAWWYWTLAWGVGAASNGLLYLGAARVALWLRKKLRMGAIVFFALLTAYLVCGYALLILTQIGREGPLLNQPRHDARQARARFGHDSRQRPDRARTDERAQQADTQRGEDGGGTRIRTGVQRAIG
jgi:hypothetical protein